MGTWYETCSISRLPIRSDDEVVIIYLKKNNHIFEEWCGSGDSNKWYNPIDFPFVATCNIDEDFEVEGNEEKTQGINEIRRGNKEGYDMIFILRKIYDEIMSEMQVRDGIRNRIVAMADAIDCVELKEYDYPIPQTRLDRFYLEGPQELRNIYRNYCANPNETLKNQMVDLFLLDATFDMMRIPWHPGIGRGSQATEYFLHRKVAEHTIEHEKKRREEWLEDNILDEDESEDSITKMYLWYI